MRVENIYKKFIKKYPNLDLKLASGGLTDVKGKNTSDVDITYYTNKLNDTSKIFCDALSMKNKNNNVIIYSYKYYGREVNVYCTNNKDLAIRGVTHRRNELMLNKYPLLVSQAIMLKLEGYGTEPAWAKVLELSGDPYEAMLDKEENLEKIAISKNLIYKNIINNLQKK